MEKIQIRTYTSLLLLPFALYQAYIGFYFVAQATALLAFIAADIDNLRITGTLQKITLYLATFVLILVTVPLDTGFPFIEISLLVSVVGLTIRILFIKTFAYSNYRFIELFFGIISFVLIFLGVIPQIENWFHFIPAYVLVILLIILAITRIKDTGYLKEGAESGYQNIISNKAPDFFLPDQNGNGVSLSEFRDKRNVLLIFVRGDWCPYCHMIMRTYMREKHRFQQKNVMLIAIGPDPVGINREMAIRLGLDYRVLHDEKMKVAQDYGILLPDFKLAAATFHEEGMPLPASFLIDKKGEVVYTSRKQKVGEFLDPSLIFPILESLD